MTGPVIAYRVSFRTARQPAKYGQVSPPEAEAKVQEPKTPPSRDRTVTGGSCRAARVLALACFIERGIDAGGFKSYGDAARRIGIKVGRATQLMNVR